MTTYELAYLLSLPLEHALYQHVHRVLRKLKPVCILDIGGRRSNYTIGLKSQVWISELPRVRDIQCQLDLGATDEIKAAVLSRRSNIVKYVYDDMTETKLLSAHFDVVSAIEVLEHVDDDISFLRNVATVLQPGGHFVMTTPNGDWIPKPYPDHKRHYKVSALISLLSENFSDVRVYYMVNADRLFGMGYRGGRFTGMWAYGANALIERLGFGGKGPSKKNHLVAICQK